MKKKPVKAYKPEQTTPLNPSPVLLSKLGSIVVHTAELLSPAGHEFDRQALNGLMADAEVCEWLKQMDAMAMLPKKRTNR